MAKTYIVTPNYTTRPPPSLSNLATPKNGGETSKPSEEAEISASVDNLELGTTSSDPDTLINSAGTLFLGDILRDPLGAELRVINRKDRLQIPKDLLILPPDIKENFKATRNSLLKGRFGFWATLLAGLGLPAGVDIGVALERNSNDVISAAEMETQEIEVDDDFVKKTMKLSSVEAYLEGCRNPPPPLYMVTGLKIVRGAGAKSEITASMEASLGAQALGGDAVKILEFVKSRTTGQEFDWSTPFVLAFRVRKILYKRGMWEHTLSQKGASMMEGNQAIKSPEVEITGVGGTVEVDADMVEYGDVLVKMDEQDDAEWIIPNID